jgi:hypothetical protein
MAAMRQSRHVRFTGGDSAPGSLSRWEFVVRIYLAFEARQ